MAATDGYKKEEVCEMHQEAHTKPGLCLNSMMNFENISAASWDIFGANCEVPHLLIRAAVSFGASGASRAR